MRTVPFALALASLCGSALLACGDGANENSSAWVSPIPFDTVALAIVKDADTVRVLAEVADTPERRAFGLMTRPSLDAESGMLFRYDAQQDSAAGFWMFRTQLPLDIAFADSAGTIVKVMSMDPCTSPNAEWCPQYSPGAPYWMALEVNRGFFANRGIGPGHRIIADSRGDTGH